MRQFSVPAARGQPAAARCQQARCHRPRSIILHSSAAAVSVSPSVTSLDTTEQQSEPQLGWRQGLEDAYFRGKVIGHGSFGLVYLGVHAESGRQFAIKEMPKTRPKLTKAKVLEKVSREARILGLLRASGRVVDLEECFEDAQTAYLVTEALGVDLQCWAETIGPLPERCLALVGLEILHILQACHQLGVVHGDVKPANFCLTDEHRHPLSLADAALQQTPWLKGVDMGCSQLHQGQARLTKRSGTPVYMAPEIYKRDYSYETDVWSLGVLLYQLYSRRFPFWDDDSYCKAISLECVAKAITEAHIRYDYGPWLSMSPEGLDLVQRCLTRDPARRISVQDALAHPWLARVTHHGGHQGEACTGAQPAAANNIIVHRDSLHGARNLSAAA